MYIYDDSCNCLKCKEIFNKLILLIHVGSTEQIIRIVLKELQKDVDKQMRS